jgi:hypothetical protein
MTLYSYIVTHDTGFSPNPFFGHCTLACCKPEVRKHADKGDWIVGLTPKPQGNKIVYFMRVDECMEFDKYWQDPRFRDKKPKFGAGVERKTGDNIYERGSDGTYRQLSSVHSSPPLERRESRQMMARDLSVNRVLISETFAYFGAEGISLPNEFKSFVVGRGHKCHFPPALIENFVHNFVPKWELRVHARPRNAPESDEPFHVAGCGKA